MSVRVRNTGPVSGAAVPQVHLGAPSRPPSGAQFAVRQLSQFARVTLAPARSQWVTVTVPLRQLQYWSASDQRWLTAGGRRTVYVGDADATGQLPLQATVDIPSHANVTCDDAQPSATMVSGRLTVPHGSWCDLVDASVAGDARISGTGVRIAGSTIGGDLDVLGTQGAADPLSAQTNIVCNTTVHGDLVVAASGVVAPWDIGQCGPNVIHGDLVFVGNHASGNSIEGNTIDRDLVCAHNGGLTSSHNTVKGRTRGRCGA